MYVCVCARACVCACVRACELVRWCLNEVYFGCDVIIMPLVVNLKVVVCKFPV